MHEGGSSSEEDLERASDREREPATRGSLFVSVT